MLFRCLCVLFVVLAVVCASVCVLLLLVVSLTYEVEFDSLRYDLFRAGEVRRDYFCMCVSAWR